VLRRLLLALLPLTLLAAACAGGDDTADEDGDAPAEEQAAGESGAEARAVYPGEEWATAEPAEVGLAPEPLAELSGVIEDAGGNCLAVVKDGQVVVDEAWNGTDSETGQEVWSATKSITSMLVGIAQEEGALDIEQPASDFIEEWQGTGSEDVTIRNLLSNDSGRYYDFRNDYVSMAFQAEDKSAFAIGLDQQHPPGEHWEYNNSAIQVLEEVLQRATGQEVAAYAQEHLFEPLGMSAEMRTDQAGNTLVFMGAQASCLDMARFGLLALHEGAWDGEQVVPAAWVSEATAPSQDVNPSYGFLWWLFEEGSALVEPGQPDPPAAYAAIGLGGQIVLVIPDDGLVVVRLGPEGITDVGSGTGQALVAPLLGYAHQAVAEG
jgi:CubicO group peptidase (beta-lactamase class C family)